MLRRIAAVVALGTLPALLPAQAVVPACAGRAAQDACQKAADMFAFVAPQFGALLAGGNATPGQTGPIGGFGHFSFGLRLNGVRADLPDTRQLALQPGAAERSTIPTATKWAALPVLDVDVGLFRGFPVGMSFIGGLDLLLTGAWLPSLSAGGVRLAVPGSNSQLGLGARLGLIRETIHLPGVDLTVSRNKLPKAELRSLTEQGDTLTVLDAHLRADSWRLVAGKSYFSAVVAAGVGQDRYRSSATVAADGPSATAGASALPADPVGLEQRLTRTNVFANVALNAAPLRLTGEVGRAWGGTVSTFNDFQGARADAPRMYGSVGLRVGF